MQRKMDQVVKLQTFINNHHLLHASYMLAILDKLSLMSLNLTSPHGTHKKIMFREIKRLSPGHMACFHELESTKSAQCENLCHLP